MFSITRYEGSKQTAEVKKHEIRLRKRSVTAIDSNRDGSVMKMPKNGPHLIPSLLLDTTATGGSIALVAMKNGKKYQKKKQKAASDSVAQIEQDFASVQKEKKQKRLPIKHETKKNSMLQPVLSPCHAESDEKKTKNVEIADSLHELHPELSHIDSDENSENMDHNDAMTDIIDVEHSNKKTSVISQLVNRLIPSLTFCLTVLGEMVC